MKVERGASQVMFGLLPKQTADLEGRIWRVSHWVDPVPVPLDHDAVRTALLRSIAPWTAQGTDDGLAQELRTHADVEIVGLNMDRGVLVEPFPQQWRCKSCNSIAKSRDAACPCGARSRAQMQFVAYHTCGASREPILPRSCPQHQAIAVRLPGTSTAKELRFYCPKGKASLGKGGGFGFQHCDCGNKGMSTSMSQAPRAPLTFRGRVRF